MRSSRLLRWGNPAAMLTWALLGRGMMSSKPGRTVRNANPVGSAKGRAKCQLAGSYSGAGRS